MEMTDGIDFEAWNATVRSLAAAVDRLERTVARLADPPWAKPLLEALDEVSLLLKNPEEIPLWYPATTEVTPADPVPSDPVDPATLPVAAEPDRSAGPVLAPGERPASAVPRVQFGDPDAIANYGRRRRR